MNTRIWRTYGGITKVSEFKKGDKVIYKVSGEEGIVTVPRPDGVRGFVLVQFSPGSDGYYVRVSELIEKA